RGVGMLAMSPPLQASLAVLLVVAASVWLGGYVAIAVVAFTARNTLEAQHRVTFFRALGRAFLPVGGAALLVAQVSGTLLLLQREWDALTLATLVLEAGLIALLAVAVAQARRMTRLRQRALHAGAGAELAAQVARGGRAAGLL